MLDDRLARLVPHVGLSCDAYWDHVVRIDPGEHLRMRVRQKAYLARYGRQSVLQWEGREVAELNEHFAAMSEIIREENALSRGSEDR